MSHYDYEDHLLECLQGLDEHSFIRQGSEICLRPVPEYCVAGNLCDKLEAVKTNEESKQKPTEKPQASKTLNLWSKRKVPSLIKKSEIFCRMLKPTGSYFNPKLFFKERNIFGEIFKRTAFCSLGKSPINSRDLIG